MLQSHAGRATNSNFAGRRRWRRRAFALIVVGFLFSSQEVVLRALFPIPEVIGFNRIHYQLMAGSHLENSEILRRGLAYNRLLFESRPDGYSEVHRLNLHGFRGPDFAIDPIPGRRRILVIGDSVAEGQGAPESSTISAQLARLLLEDGIDAEVINLGVVAASLPRLTKLARDATALLHPTDVVFMVNANDLPPPTFSADLREPSPVFARVKSAWWVPRGVALLLRIADGQPIYRRWFHAATPFLAAVPDPTNPWTGKDHPPPNLAPELYRAMVDGALNPWLKDQLTSLPGMIAYDYSVGGLPALYFRRIDQVCRQAGARLTVAYVPFYGVTHPRYAPAMIALGMDRTIAERLSTDPSFLRQRLVVSEICSSLGVPLADTTDPLIRAERESGPQFWSYDSHPRPSGYATMTRKIHEVMRESIGEPRRSKRG
jgi:lysophospholipase L1-like esterase